MPKTISKKYNTLRQAERYQNLLYNKFDNVKLIKSPMFTEYGTYVWAVSGEINSQPKKKNAFSGGEKGLTFHGKEIHSVFIGNTSNNKLGVMVMLSDGTSVNFFGVDRQRLSRSGGLGQPISAQSLLNLLIAKYVK